jgi:Protein of unknown function (DUF4100)
VKKKAKTTLEDVVVCEKGDTTRKQVSLAYQFTSELQESINIEDLYRLLLDKEVTVKLSDVLGLSFELCKRLQVATKTQRIPVSPEVVRNKNLEVSASLLESGINFLETKKGPRHPLINHPPKDIQTSAVSINSDDESTNKDGFYDSDSGSGQDTNNQAENYYRRQLEIEHDQVFNLKNSDYSFSLTFLAMVTAKIQGTIMG